MGAHGGSFQRVSTRGVEVNLDQRSINFASGSRAFGPFTVPDGYTQVRVILARKTTATPTYWADGVSVKFSSECSTDGGVTWVEWIGFTGVGGIHVRRDSVEAPESWAQARLPLGTGRRIRAAVTISGGRLVSVLTVEVT